MKNSENNQPTHKPQLPKRDLLYVFKAGIVSLWKPVEVASTLEAADKTLRESEALCARDRELAKASREVLLKSP